MDGQLLKHRTLEAIKRLLVRESLAQPLLIIFEDLHWFDAESLEFMTLLADSLPALRMLMLVNHGPAVCTSVRTQNRTIDSCGSIHSKPITPISCCPYC